MYYTADVAFTGFLDAAENERCHAAANRRRQAKGDSRMNNELLERCTGQTCKFTMGVGVSQTVKGAVLSVNGNWIELQTKKEIRLLNADYISYVEFCK